MKHYAWAALEPVVCAVALIAGAAAFTQMHLSAVALIFPTPTPGILADVLGHLVWWFLGPLVAGLLLPGLTFGRFWTYATVVAIYSALWIAPMFAMLEKAEADLASSG